MIEPILEELEDVVNNEFDRIRKKHGYFNSRHEAFAVGLEEVEELIADVESVKTCINILKRDVFLDYTTKGVKRDARKLELCAKHAAAEAVQVAAVAMKFKLLLDSEKKGDD